MLGTRLNELVDALAPSTYYLHAAWKDVEIGGTIRITVMLAAGYKDEISWVDLGVQDRGVHQVEIRVCGGHPDTIVSGPPPESERTWRVVVEKPHCKAKARKRRVSNGVRVGAKS